MATYINKLQASGNTLDEAVEDFKRKLEYVMVPMYPEEFETREIQGQTYMYLNGEWSLQLDEVVITARTITNTRAFIIASSGIRLHKTASPHDTEYVSARSGKNVSATNIATTIYKPGEEILYIGPSQNAKGWAFIQTSDGKQGHIERHHIMILEKNAILDNFTQAYHYVKQEGEGLESIINTYFANYNFKRGKDKRTIAEALIFLNQSSDHDHGLYFKQEEKGIFEKVHSGVIDAHDPWFQKARELYKTVQVPLYTVLRIPTVAYIEYLAKIGKLSQRPDLVNEMINVGEIIVDVAAGIAGVIVGIIEGFVVGIWDALVGLVDLVSSIIDVIKKLVQGTFIEDLRKMYAMMIGLSWEDIKKLGDAISGGLISQIQNFSTLSAFEKGRVIGKIIGMVLLEVVLAFFTGGAANAAKWAGKLGKFAKVAKTIAKVGDDVLGPLNKMNKKLIDKISDKVPKKFKNKNGKGDYEGNDKKNIYRQLLLNQARLTAELFDANGSTLAQLKTSLNLSEKAYPKLGNVKWPAKHIRDNVYSLGMVASPEKMVDKHFTSGTKGKDKEQTDLTPKELDEIQKVGGKFPSNAKDFSGRTFSFDLDKNPRMSRIMEKRWSNKGYTSDQIKKAKKEFKELLKNYPKGVKFTNKGFPDFSPYYKKYKGKNVEVTLDKLNPGKRGSNKDIREAIKKFKKENPEWKQPDGTTWHHIENSTKLQLVPSDIHDAVKHFGGRSTNSK